MAHERTLSIDLVRLVAAYGVMLVHLAPSTIACEAFTRVFLLFAVPFFLLTSLQFFLAKILSLSEPRFSDLRLDRLIVPYVIWSAIYTVMRAIKFHWDGKHFEFDLIQFVFNGGAGVQLYFIPLLLLFQTQALVIVFLFRSPRWSLISLCSALLAIVLGSFANAMGYVFFHDIFLRGLGYVGLAFAFRYLNGTASGRRLNFFVGWLIIPFIVFTALLAVSLDALGLMTGPIIGYAFTAFALNWRFQTSARFPRFLLTCSYGIFLAHFGFLEGFEFLAGKFGMLLTPYSISSKLFIASGLFMFCIGFIWIARRHWITAYLFLGEAPNEGVE